MLLQHFKNFRDRLIQDQVRRVRIPDFTNDTFVRLRITFSGRVQKVGFRLELQELATRLGLTGYCKNLPDGDVLAEIQGPRNKIRFLIEFMESRLRIHIASKLVQPVEIVTYEDEFQKL